MVAVLKQASPHREAWHAHLRPYVNFIPVRRDMSDLEVHVSQMQILQHQLINEKEFMQKENLQLRQLLRQARTPSLQPVITSA